VKVLEDCLRDDFRGWMVRQTKGNSRPIAEATAHEHVMSMNNLLKRVVMKVGRGREGGREGGRMTSREGRRGEGSEGGREGGRRLLTSFTLPEKEEVEKLIRTKEGGQVLREEGAKLTYGRVTAFKYFCKYMGVGEEGEEEEEEGEEEEEEGGREGGRGHAHSPPPPPVSSFSSSLSGGGGGGGREGGRGGGGGVVGLVLLQKEVKKGFKKWLIRRGGGGGGGGGGGREGGREGGKEEAEGFLTVSLYIMHQTFNRVKTGGGREGGR